MMNSKLPFVQARDPQSTVIFSKLEQNDAELSFKNRIPGRHSFCLTLSKKSWTRSRIARHVHLDILVGQTWTHNKITEDHLDEMFDDISNLGELIQKLMSEMRHFKYREARHRQTVESTSRRVIVYTVLKLVVIALIVVAQPLILMWLIQSKEKL
jgi:p24 family protein beta-1